MYSRIMTLLAVLPHPVGTLLHRVRSPTGQQILPRTTLLLLENQELVKYPELPLLGLLSPLN